MIGIALFADGNLQFIAMGAQTIGQAVGMFDDAASINPDDLPFSELVEQFTGYQIADHEQLDALNEWADHMRADEFPLTKRA